MSDISHQTKTPISNIMLYTELMSENEQLDENSKKLLSSIKMQTEKLNFLIQALVKTSRLENGIVEVEPKENSINSVCIGEIEYAHSFGRSQAIAAKQSQKILIFCNGQ